LRGKAFKKKNEKKNRRRRLLEKILHAAPLVDPKKIPDPIELIRTDRER